MTTFDPWVLEKGGGEGGGEFEDKFPATLVVRARKRKVFQRSTGWLVSGLKGEMKSFYNVALDTDTHKYHCECYDTQHGESRAKRMCSHSLAVVLWRRENKPRSNGATENREDGGAIEEPVLTVGVGVGSNVDSESQFISDGLIQGTYPDSPADSPTDSRTDIPDVDDPMWGGEFPSWMTEIRGHQWDAVQEVMEAFEHGAKNVWLDAPTGAGKTLIGEMVRRLLKVKAFYVCSSKTLQSQFVTDYDYAKVLMGRANYPTELMAEPYNCGDCSGAECGWCEQMSSCPYQMAKRAAMQGQVAVLNTSYLLAEANHVGDVVKGSRFTVLDECDMLERELMGFVEFNVGERMLRDLGIKAPKKGSHKTTIQEWMQGELPEAIKLAVGRTRTSNLDVLERTRRQTRLARLTQQAVLVGRQVHQDEWIRDNDAGPLVMKPVKVGSYGQGYLWRHSEKWLSMSATIISPDELQDSLGIRGEECALVRVPMTFPVENRRIRVAPIANMVAKEKEAEWPKMATAIRRIMELHPTERILVHTVSYDLSRYLHGELRRTNRAITYNQSSERDASLARFRQSSAGVLLASSLDRGVDLKDDDCRVVIVAKMPYQSLGDKQVSARMHMENGQAWYSVQTIRSLVQMTGRGVRHAEDWCVSYILDRQFVSNLYKRNKSLFPKWWAESLDMNFPVRSLMQ